MKSVITVRVAGLAVSAFAALAAAQPTDSFHITQIEQVIRSVNGDSTKQAIQLRMRSFGQQFMASARVIVRDAAGANPIIVKDMTTNCSSGNPGDHVLICSAAFAASTTPVTVPDYTITNPIPASYFAAGRLTFEDDFGTIYWSLSWGGAAYTGPTTGSITNDADGIFGPSVSFQLPSSGAQAMRFTGTLSAPSTNNAADYALTSGATTWVNNAGASFTLSAGPAPCYPNCDNSTVAPTLNANDFQCFLNLFATGCR